MNSRISTGFTLAEVIIGSALLFTCLTIAVFTFTAVSQNFANSKETIDAYQNCQNILEMIITEIREADSDTITVENSRVSFRKYHKPSGRDQQVTWSYDRGREKVIRSYVGGHPTEFGENVINLTFTELPPKETTLNKLYMVEILIEVKGKKISASGERRDIIMLETNVYLRPKQTIKVDTKILGVPPQNP